MVFHLEVESYSNIYDSLVEKDSYYSGVYGTMKKAVEEGKWFLERRFKDIFENSNYCTKEDKDYTYEDLLNDGYMSYNFKVTKLSPYYAENFEAPGREYMCRDLRPTHTVYYYDYRGNLEFYNLEYLDRDGGFGYVTRRYKGDNEKQPNKFNIGDFVTVIDDDFPADQVFVVYYVPVKNDPYRFFNNTYGVASVFDGCKFDYYHDYNESKLIKYDGIVDKNSPLMFLQKLYRNEIQIDKEIMKQIENREILLNTKPTFMDIPEIREVFCKGDDKVGDK